MTDADKKAKRREILKSYAENMRRYRDVRNLAVWRAERDFDEQSARLRSVRDNSLAALEKEAKLP